ncbi:hypothetical protein [Empedobacter sp. UBA7248]|uniref:hypothetical protein n=1 Tax=Empedobacter sp. UBA7248 TaxID=1946448 RepID=UPI0025C58542|nr:hypothetical protein [Empedobacter sp. UBA7248]
MKVYNIKPNTMTNEITEEIDQKLENIYTYILTKKNTYKFNLSHLPEINDYTTNILEAIHFDEIFKELNKKTHNCIYWFELKDEQKCLELNTLLDNNREKLSDQYRVIPPKNKNQDSNVLYVGIRRGGVRKRDQLSNLSGRIVQHLGYYERGSTQGLQLVHWCKGLDFDINLNVVELENLPNDYLNVVEKILSYHLKPLCGRH